MKVETQVDQDYGGAECEEIVESAKVQTGNEIEEPEPRRTSRSNAGKISRDENFKYSFTQFTVKEGLRRYGKEAKKAVIAEFLQLFKKKNALIPVKKGS